VGVEGKMGDPGSRESPRAATIAASRRGVPRWVPGVVLLSGLLGAPVALLLSNGRDLAAGRPFRTSSTYPGCNVPYGMCANERLDIFFHTNEEESPWVEIDLGSVQSFSSVSVTNRLDSYKERAVPLAIETSTDGVTFTEAAQQKEPFSVWDAKFKPVKARYVRARALRRTWLHLARIVVR